MNPSATIAIEGEKRELNPPADPFSPFRLTQPLTQVSGNAPESDKPVCGICNARFSVARSLDWNQTGQHPRKWYGLCLRHYTCLYYTDDPDGRREVDTEILKSVPCLYRGVEFNTFKASGECGGHLADVRNAVVNWAKDISLRVLLSGIPATPPGSIYLYGSKSRSCSGNGCGKTHLAYSAFKYIARRTAKMEPTCDDAVSQPKLACAFIDIQELVSKFRRKLAESESSPVWYNYVTDDGKGVSTNFDGYLAHLASTPVLFIDDVGQGRYTDRDGNPGLAATTFETIVDIRAQKQLPTLYTSNFSPSELGQRVGTRAASRIFRDDCTPIRIKAPDYAMAKSELKTVGGLKMTNALSVKR